MLWLNSFNIKSLPLLELTILAKSVSILCTEQEPPTVVMEDRLIFALSPSPNTYQYKEVHS